jgi:hypothetical protein
LCGVLVKFANLPADSNGCPALLRHFKDIAGSGECTGRRRRFGATRNCNRSGSWGRKQGQRGQRFAGDKWSCPPTRKYRGAQRMSRRRRRRRRRWSPGERTERWHERSPARSEAAAAGESGEPAEAHRHCCKFESHLRIDVLLEHLVGVARKHARTRARIHTYIFLLGSSESKSSMRRRRRRSSKDRDVYSSNCKLCTPGGGGGRREELFRIVCARGTISNEAGNSNEGEGRCPYQTALSLQHSVYSKMIAAILFHSNRLMLLRQCCVHTHK